MLPAPGRKSAPLGLVPGGGPIDISNGSDEAPRRAPPAPDSKEAARLRLAPPGGSNATLDGSCGFGTGVAPWSFLPGLWPSRPFLVLSGVMSYISMKHFWRPCSFLFLGRTWRWKAALEWTNPCRRVADKSKGVQSPFAGPARPAGLQACKPAGLKVCRSCKACRCVGLQICSLRACRLPGLKACRPPAFRSRVWVSLKEFVFIS